MRTLVTGGGGFLGTHVVERLQREGIDPVVPRRRNYDLTHWDDVERLFHDTKPELVLHLAAEVGGIGANRETGWEPQVSWEEGIRKTIRWYADNRDRWIGRVDWLPYTAPTVKTG